jgi:hypothetical protein
MLIIRVRLIVIIIWIGFSIASGYLFASAANATEYQAPSAAPTEVPDSGTGPKATVDMTDSEIFSSAAPLAKAWSVALAGASDRYGAEVWSALLRAQTTSNGAQLNRLLKKRGYEAVSVSIAYRSPVGPNGHVDYCEHPARENFITHGQPEGCPISALVESGLDVIMRGWKTRQVSDDLGSFHTDLQQILPSEMLSVLMTERRANEYDLTGVGAMYVYERNAMRVQLLLFRAPNVARVNGLSASGFDVSLTQPRPPEFGAGWIVLDKFTPEDLERIGPNILALFRSIVVPEREVKKRQAQH